MFHGCCGCGSQAYVSCSNMCLICQIPLTPNLTPKSQELSNNLFDRLGAGWVEGQLLEGALCHSQGFKKSFPVIPGQAGAHAALHMLLHRLAVPLQSSRLPNRQWIRML